MRLGAVWFIYLFTVYTNESCSYYGNMSQLENFKIAWDKFCELTYVHVIKSSYDILTFVLT